MVPPDSLRISRVRRYSGYRLLVLIFVYGSLTLYAAASHPLPLISAIHDDGPTTPPQKPEMVWARPRSLAATEGVSFDFLSCGYLDVSVLRVGSTYVVTALRPPGFPIRTSPVHRVLARSPRLFAGSYVLHRLLLPRHPPYALLCLLYQDTCTSFPVGNADAPSTHPSIFTMSKIKLVEATGLEPTTFCVQSRCSPS